MKHVIAGEVFWSQDAIRERIRDIAKRRMGLRLANQELEFAKALLERHPDRDAKIGCGIQHIGVLKNNRNSASWCFAIRRTDGTVCDFSYKSCLRPSSARENAVLAFRDEITYQIQAARYRFHHRGGTACELTGEPISRDEEVEVDHAAPKTFAWLLEEFCKANDFDLNTVPSKEVASDRGIGYDTRALVDRSVADRWHLFHAGNATLRILKKQAHRALSSGGAA